MSTPAERAIVLGAESYEVVNAAIRARDMVDVDFHGVGEVLPRAMTVPEVEEFRTQFVDELQAQNPDWDGPLGKLNSRLVFTIGTAACFANQDRVTARSAERVLWGQGPTLSWAYAVMLERDIRKYTPKRLHG